MSAKTDAMLQAKGARSGYGGCEVLRGIDLDVHRGEVVSVVGPNGSGKSTLLRVITGLLPLYGGEVRIDGVVLKDLTARQRACRCAVQPQVEAPMFDYTVGEFVLLGRHPHRPALAPASNKDLAAVSQSLELCDLAGFEKRNIRSLSAGEWQRTLLARALAQDTPLLLLDEPAAHLDPGHRFAIHTLLRNLAREKNRAVLCVSHDLNLAAQFSDRMVMLFAGKVRAAGTPKEVMKDEILRDVFRCDALRVTENPYTGRPGTVFVP